MKFHNCHHTISGKTLENGSCACSDDLVEDSNGNCICPGDTVNDGKNNCICPAPGWIEISPGKCAPIFVTPPTIKCKDKLKRKRCKRFKKKGKCNKKWMKRKCKKTCKKC